MNMGKGLLPLHATSAPLPIPYRQPQKILVRRPPSTSLPPVSHSEPNIPLSFVRPAKAAIAPATTVPASAGQGLAPFQIEYKGRLISASQLDDGSWIATHVPLGADPSSMCDGTHRFMARILAISSAEIEIDDLEQP
jgi:hypothetical protein